MTGPSSLAIGTRTRANEPSPTRYGAWRRRINGLTSVFGALTVLLGVAMAIPGPALAEPVRILGLGDSLMAGYGLPEDAVFPAQLEAALRQRGHDVLIINAGVSGDTTAGGRSRLAWSLAEEPDAAIVELGGNDGLRGISPEDTRANLDAILTELDGRGIPTLLTGMLAPPNLGREYTDAFQKVFHDLAEKHDVIFDPFFLEGVAANPDLNQGDGIHPNAEGVAVIVDRILPKVERLIERAKVAPG